MAYLIRCPFCAYPKRVDDRVTVRCRNSLCGAVLFAFGEDVAGVTIAVDEAAPVASEQTVRTLWLHDKDGFRLVREDRLPGREARA